jgi:hypothetical protein
MPWIGSLDNLSGRSWVEETGAEGCLPPSRRAEAGGSTWRC